MEKIGFTIFLGIILGTVFIVFLCLEYSRCKKYIKRNFLRENFENLRDALVFAEKDIWTYGIGGLLHRITIDCGSVYINQGTLDADMAHLRSLIKDLLKFNSEFKSIKKEVKMIRRWKFLFCRCENDLAEDEFKKVERRYYPFDW